MSLSMLMPEVGLSASRTSDVADLLSWCQTHAARVQWGINGNDRHVLELSVPLGAARTRLVTIEMNNAATAQNLLDEAVSRMQAEMVAATRRDSLRLI